MKTTRSDYLAKCKEMAVVTTKENGNNCRFKALELEKALKKSLENSLESYQIALFFDFEDKAKLNTKLTNFLKLVSTTEDGSDYTELLEPLTTYVDGSKVHKNVDIHDILRMSCGKVVQKKTSKGKELFKLFTVAKAEAKTGKVSADVVGRFPKWLLETVTSNHYYNTDFKIDFGSVIQLEDNGIEKAVKEIKNLRKLAEEDIDHGLFESARLERVGISRFRRDFEMVAGNWFNQSLQLKDSITESKKAKRAEKAQQFSVIFDAETKKYKISGLNADFRRKVKSLLTLLDKNSVTEKSDRTKHLNKLVEIYKESGNVSDADRYYREVAEQLKQSTETETAE